jgi:hypothetical protein
MLRDDLLRGLPGEELIAEGLADLEQGRTTVPACLAAISRPRLERAGLMGALAPDGLGKAPILVGRTPPELVQDPNSEGRNPKETRMPKAEELPLMPDSRGSVLAESERTLYRLLRREGGDAYPRYNALLRRLVSFERALDHRLRRTKPSPRKQ